MNRPMTGTIIREAKYAHIDAKPDDEKRPHMVQIATVMARAASGNVWPVTARGTLVGSLANLREGRVVKLTGRWVREEYVADDGSLKEGLVLRVTAVEPEPPARK